MINGKAARCENCHKKIKVSDVKIINGLIYHGECINNTQGNVNTEKRDVLKTMGIGAIIAGASVLGIDRLASASTTISRAGGTYNQGQFVLPGLFSDPINPLPGQVWYRMDAGVTAFFDSIQGRTIYSNRNNNVITVSSRGISNGLSKVYNDGADFGPDTMLNATSKGQYGPPYTQTSGIQEAFNYSATSPLFSSDTGHLFYPIKLLVGNFEFSTPITYGIGNHSPSDSFSINIEGSGYVSTILSYTGTGTAITIDTNINNIYLGNFSVDNPNATADTMIYWDSAKGSTGNVLTVENINNGQGTSSYLMHFNNVYLATIKNVVTPSGYGIYINGSGSNSFLYMQNQIWSGTYTTIGNFDFAYISGINQYVIVNNPIGMLKITNFNNGAIFNAPVDTVLMENGVLGGNPSLIVNANVNYIKLLSNIVSGVLISSTNSPTQNTIGVLSVDGIYNTYLHEAFSNVTNVKINAYDFRNIPSGTFTTMPTQSSTNGTTAGTVSMDAVEYRIEYKKYVITFSGYENDTATNQTISYPLPFSTSAVISANNTGLTISTTTSGITITSPNSTTTYSGIVIVEGY